MENLLQDVRYSIRMLRKNPGFTLVAMIALALGIGANSAIFSVVNAILLRPLPFKDPAGLVRIWGKFDKSGIPKNWISEPELLDLKEQSQSFEDLAAYETSGANLTGTGDPVRVKMASVNASLFSILGVQARIGRTFANEEDQPGRDKVVLIADALWRSRFGSDPALVGKTLGLSGTTYTVIGIMPSGFQFPDQDELWIPLAIDTAHLDDRGNHGLEVVGRLKPGATPAQAQADLTNIAATLEQRYPNSYANSGWGLYPVSMLDELVGNIRPALYILLGSVGFVLLIACANVANLLLARASAREKEVAIRAAMGARRGRLIRQLLTESVILAAIGSSLGLVLAYLGVKIFVAFGPREIPRIAEIGLDTRVVGFSVLMALVTGLAFGLAPAVQISKPDLHESLKEGGRGSTSGRHRLRNALVVSEMAIALVLLVGAGLMIKSFQRLLQLDLGYRTKDILTMRMEVPSTKYGEDGPKVAAFYHQLLDKIKALPGVESAGVISHLPLSGSYTSGSVAVENPEPQEGLQTFRGAAYIEADRRRVSPDYFATLGITLKEGRLFTDADNETAPPVAIVDESFQRRFWPNGSAVGKRFVASFSNGNLTWGQIVGVVSHIRHYGVDQVKQFALGQEGREQAYFPQLQRPSNQMYLAIKTTTDPLSLASTVRSQVSALDPEQPIYDVRSMDQLVDRSLAQRQLNMILFAAFSGIALILAAVGIYGVMSYSVTQRTHEIGIRMALGARQSSVLGLVVRQGMALALAGVGIGLGLALALTRLMSGLLYGVSSTDPDTFAVIAAVLTAVALAACLVPARRATKVDPMVALRYE